MPGFDAYKLEIAIRFLPFYSSFSDSVELSIKRALVGAIIMDQVNLAPEKLLICIKPGTVA